MERLGILVQIARRVEALDRARAFLRDTMGLAELYAFPGLAFFDLGGTRLMLRETGRKEEADLLYFGVADIEAVHAALMFKGVTFREPPHVIHTHTESSQEWMAFSDDDEGRLLALHAVTSPRS